MSLSKMDGPNWMLIWHDEFEGTQLDSTKWNVDIGYTGESNAELEVYYLTGGNLRLENSLLIIEARANPTKVIATLPPG